MAQTGPFRGNCLATIDDRGRLKLPTAFRTRAIETYGPDFYLTSFNGESLLLYPISVWLEIEAQVTSTLFVADPVRIKAMQVAAYYGQEDTLDAQGRLLVPPRLREPAGMIGEVDVLGQQDYLEVWNSARFVEKLKNDPYTRADAAELALKLKATKV